MSIPALSWESFMFESSALESLSDVHSVAVSQMKEIGLSNVENRKSEVVGTTADTIVSVCFVVFSKTKYMAIVMAAGDHAVALRDKLITRFGKVAFL